MANVALYTDSRRQTYLLIGTEDGEGSGHGQEPDQIPEQVERVLSAADQQTVHVSGGDDLQRQLAVLLQRPRVLRTVRRGPSDREERKRLFQTSKSELDFRKRNTACQF